MSVQFKNSKINDKTQEGGEGVVETTVLVASPFKAGN